MARDANFPWGNIHIPPNWKKPCSAKQWNDGILAVSSITSLNVPGLTMFDDLPSAIAPDGVGGAFVLTVCDIFVPMSLGPFALRAIGPTGVRSNLVKYQDPLAFIGVIGVWEEAVIVPSGSKRCIVLWANDQMYSDLSGQRYDETLAPLWQNGTPVKVSRNFYAGSISKSSLIAEPDGKDGVISAWVGRNQAGYDEVRMQRLDSDGNPLWGRDGISFGSVSTQQYLLPQTWVQMVATRNGGAIVVAPENTGASIQLTAQVIDRRGNLVGAPVTAVANVPNSWMSHYRLRRAVADGADGLYLTYTNAQGILRALRFSSAGNVSWDIQVGTPMNPAAYSIREDDRGGCLVAFVSNNPFQKAELIRIDGNGNITWNINSSTAGNVPLLIQLPVGSTNWTSDDWSRLIQAVPDANGGALLVHQSWPGGSAKLFTSCFDATGKQVSPTQNVSARQTSQEMPVVIPGGGTSAIVAWADDERASTHGLDVWAQRIGCCIPEPIGEQPYPRFGCEIIQFGDGSHFRELILEFPCGNRDLQWGLIPLTRFFASIRGLHYPGSIFNRDVESPDWIRIQFLGLPKGCKVQVYSLKGKLVADGKISKGQSKEELVLTTLTFKPSDEDQLIVFTNDNTVDRGTRLPVRVNSDWGNGKPTEFPPRKEFMMKSKAGTSIRKKSQRRRR
jgi:hypothetical protein